MPIGPYWLCDLHHCSQLPMQITVNNTDLAHVLPLEICGWLMRKLAIQAGDWLLVATPDTTGLLAAQLNARAPMAVNVVVGVTAYNSNPVLCYTGSGEDGHE